MSEPARGNPGSWEHLALWTAAGNIDLEATLATLPASDRDAAALIATMWPGELHYVPGTQRMSGRWYTWTGRHHQPDDSGLITRRIMIFTRMLDTLFDRCRQQAEAEVTAAMAGKPATEIKAALDQRWQAWDSSPQLKYARGLRSTPKSRSLIEWCGGDLGVAPDVVADRHPRLLNAGNCAVSLMPAPGEPEWYPHDPALMMTYLVEACWQPSEAPWSGCPEFADMLHRACGRDDEVATYLAKALGYALLGGNPLQLVFFLSGPTASGKSKLLEIVSTVLGPALAYEAKPQLIGSLIGSRDSRHSRHEAAMAGKRMITISETNDRLAIDEMQLKRLTGEARLSVEFLYRSTMTSIDVSFVIFIANNEMPSVAHLDAALRRRIVIIPMGATIPEWERDTGKVARIVERERDGVLALLVWACRLAMSDQGQSLLMPPAAVVAKTQKYQAEQNTVALWRADSTFPVNGNSAPQRGSSCLADYRAWCSKPGIERIALGRNNFYDALSAEPGVIRTGPEDQAWFHGFMLKNPPMDD